VLNFLGIGGAFNPEYGNNSAYIKRDKGLIIIDCGSTVFGDIKPKIDAADSNDIHIFITHTHTDHVGSLGTTLDYVYYVKKGKANLYFPDPKIIDMLIMMKISTNHYIFNSELTNEVCGLTVSFYETKHLLDNCYGLIIKDNHQTICYSSDCSEITLLQDFLQGKINTLYLDVSSNESKVHVPYKSLLTLVPNPADRSRLYVMHLDKYFDKKQAIKDGFNVAERECDAL